MIIGTYATNRYRYALPNFGRRLASAINYSKEKNPLVLFVGCENKELRKDAQKYVADVLPSNAEFVFEALPLNDENLTNYKDDTQLLIAQLQGFAFEYARKHRAKKFWSIESDVLVPYNALNVSKDILKFDKGYYDIVMCSYPSQGGGPFLGGRGSYQRHIEEDISMDERVIPKALQSRYQKHLKIKDQDKDDAWVEELKTIDEEIKKCEPKGNVWSLNSKQWKKRGWMDYAYPAIGKGAIVPTDWVGLGCTMLTEKALALAHFDGYEGQGTQDLYLCWNRWNLEGLNMAVTTHAICDHIIRERSTGEQDYENFKIVNAYHEPEGETKGHLRQRFSEHYQMVAGEKPKKSPTIVGEESE